jgi:hypothetical protein
LRRISIRTPARRRQVMARVGIIAQI